MVNVQPHFNFSDEITDKVILNLVSVCMCLCLCSSSGLSARILSSPGCCGKVMSVRRTPRASLSGKAPSTETLPELVTPLEGHSDVFPRSFQRRCQRSPKGLCTKQTPSTGLRHPSFRSVVLITLRASLPGTFLQKEGCRKPMPLGVWVLIRLWKRPNTHVNMKRVHPGKKKKMSQSSAWSLCQTFAITDLNPARSDSPLD